MLYAALMKSRKESENKSGNHGSKIGGNTLGDLSHLLESERLKTKEGAERIDNQITDELESIEMKILNYKLEREECQGNYKKQLAECNQKIMDAIEIEKKEREVTNTSLLNLLEDACSKIERRFATNYL